MSITFTCQKCGHFCSSKYGCSYCDNKRIHLIHRQVGWAIRKEGNTKAYRVFKYFFSALIFGFKLSRRNKTKLVVHRKDASILKRL